MPYPIRFPALLLGATLTIGLGFAPEGLWSQDGPVRGESGGRSIAVGTVAPASATHVIRRPGAYGLGPPPEGQHYAIIRGMLVRVETGSGLILSALRRVPAILD